MFFISIIKYRIFLRAGSYFQNINIRMTSVAGFKIMISFCMHFLQEYMHLIANLMISNAKESLKVISIPDIEIVLHRDGFPSLGESYEVMKTDNKSG